MFNQMQIYILKFISFIVVSYPQLSFRPHSEACYEFLGAFAIPGSLFDNLIGKLGSKR